MAVPTLQYLPARFHFKVQCLPSGEVAEGSQLIREWKDIDKCQYFANVPISPRAVLHPDRAGGLQNLVTKVTYVPAMLLIIQNHPKLS
jgi:hypothetical protein